MNFISEEQGKECIDCFGTSYCLCHQISHSIQQEAHIFLSLPFSTDLFAKAVVVFHAPCQIQLHMGFGFSNPRLVHTNCLYLSQVTMPFYVLYVSFFLSFYMLNVALLSILNYKEGISGLKLAQVLCFFQS